MAKVNELTEVKVTGVQISLSLEEAKVLRRVLGESTELYEVYDLLDDILEEEN